MRISALAFLAALLLVATHAPANEALFHPHLTAALKRVDSARGPEAYSAIRDIWRTWDRADPSHVEEGLLDAERNPKLSPAARVYAGLLAAYARSRRGDLDTEARRIEELGYVSQWLNVGPFDNEGKGGLDTEYGPELDFDKAISTSRSYRGKARQVKWRRVPAAAFPFGWVDLGVLMRPERKVCGYVTTFVTSKKDARTPRPITAWVGATGAFKMFWNGQEVLKDTAYRTHDPDRLAATVRLKPGVNALTLKVCGDEKPPAVSVRLGDARGGPGAEVEVKSDLALAPGATKNAVPRGTKPQKPGRGPLGPLQAFRKITEKETAKPADLEAFAEYLAVTGGDDPAAHKARDMASRAAEKAPTIDRLLLAARLAEDRNRRAEWIKKAEDLAKRGRPNVDVLLAQARLARRSQNWRLAFPFYDKVLALEPDNVDGLRGRVELYNEAGLRRTALATLERATERNPTSVLLLNMYASQLRALGRSTEASEVERRYSQLRFDDGSFIAVMIETALQRRDRPAAEHWVGRLLQMDPDSLWATGVAARAYQRLGQHERAIAAYEKALALAPEDVSTMRTLADLHGRRGDRDKQLALLKNILKIRPQQKDVREYVEHIVPPKPRADEAYAWAADRFLRMRHAAPKGQNRRTLLDLTVTTVFENGLSSKFRQVVFQPLTDAAAATARQYAFQYQADTQTVTLRGAKVYRGDGRIDEAIESGEAPANDPSITMYTSGRNFYIQFPRLEPGDVVELRYRVEDVTARNQFADYFGEVTYLQSNEPVEHGEYVLITPKKRTFYIHASGLPGLKRSQINRGDQRIYRFVASKVPAITPEPSMPPWSEVLGHVHVSTYKTWKDLGSWYWGLVKDQFDLDDETRKLAQEVAKGAKTDLEKVKAVYGWVVKKTRYVALEFGIYGYKPRRCVQTVARGWGDCKDKATVIVSLLEELGIPATIVVVRTQLRGDFDPRIASFAPFDHAIAYVPSLGLYLDGTAEYTGSGELPTMDLGARALLINQGDTKLVTLPEADPTRNVKERKVVAAVAANGNAKLDLSYVTRGASAPAWRRRYHAAATLRERISADLGREFPGFAMTKGPVGVTSGDLEDIEKPATIRVRGNAPGFARKEGDQLSMAVTTGQRLTPSYASLSKRRLDVKLPPLGTTDDTFVVKLPPGMKVVSAPPTASADTPFGSYSIALEKKGAEVIVKSKLVVKASRIKPAQYAAWQKFCAEADRALSHRLIVGP